MFVQLMKEIYLFMFVHTVYFLFISAKLKQKVNVTEMCQQLHIIDIINKCKHRGWAVCGYDNQKHHCQKM